MHSLYDNVSVVSSILPIVGNDDTEGTGTGVDLKGYESAVAIAHIGVSGDTLSGTVLLTPTLEESNDNITFTAVAAADMEGAFTVVDAADEDAVVQSVGYKGSKRYLRVLVDFTGTHTTGTPISAVIVRGVPRHVGVTA